MKNKNYLTPGLNGSLTLALAASLLAGCHSDQACCPEASGTHTSAPAAAVGKIVPVETTAAPVPLKAAIRINAGATEPFTDASGNVWLADQGFTDGDTVDRADVIIANAKDPGIYRTERYSMTAFSRPLPNGKYTVKLHFAETYEGITGAGQRVFSFNVEGHEFKNFDLWVKAGGGLRAYVETVNVEITDGKLDITFTSNIENPQINGLEIIPAS